MIGAALGCYRPAPLSTSGQSSVEEGCNALQPCSGGHSLLEKAFDLSGDRGIAKCYMVD